MLLCKCDVTKPFISMNWIFFLHFCDFFYSISFIIIANVLSFLNWNSLKFSIFFLFEKFCFADPLGKLSQFWVQKLSYWCGKRVGTTLSNFFIIFFYCCLQFNELGFNFVCNFILILFAISFFSSILCWWFLSKQLTINTLIQLTINNLVFDGYY
jgi:hypothetical protein